MTLVEAESSDGGFAYVGGAVDGTTLLSEGNLPEVVCARLAMPDTKDRGIGEPDDTAAVAMAVRFPLDLVLFFRALSMDHSFRIRCRSSFHAMIQSPPRDEGRRQWKVTDGVGAVF